MADLGRDLARTLTAFGQAPPSRLRSHQSSCCPRAREVLIGEFLVEADVASALGRIPMRLSRGDTVWPCYWCEVEKAPTADSGVFADLAAHVLDEYGIEYHRGRAVLAAPPGDATRRTLPPALVCREVLGVAVRWWEPTDRCWIGDVGDRTPTGTVIALAEDGHDWTVAPTGWPIP